MNEDVPRGGEQPTSAGVPEEQEAPGSPSVVTQVVTKIRHEPFLFVIAIVVLLGGVVVRTSDLGSADFRLLVAVIAFLSTVAILGYFVISAVLARDTPTQGIRGKVDVRRLSGDARLGGVRVRGRAPEQMNISGEAKVGTAEGGQAFGVDIGSEDDTLDERDDRS